MKLLIKIALFVTLGMAVFGGCTKQAWYEGMKAGHASDCNRLEGEAREKCLKNSDMSYDQYENSRK